MDDPPFTWKAVATGVWIAAVLGGGAMWATLRVSEWLRSPFVRPLPDQSQPPRSVP